MFETNFRFTMGNSKQRNTNENGRLRDRRFTIKVEKEVK